VYNRCCAVNPSRQGSPGDEDGDKDVVERGMAWDLRTNVGSAPMSMGEDLDELDTELVVEIPDAKGIPDTLAGCGSKQSLSVQILWQS
jgi:hypothetical protein